MRPKINTQPELDFQPSNLKLTNEYYKKYETISSILDENPQILNAAHKDLKHALKAANKKTKGKEKFEYTSDTIIRIIICRKLEGMSYRQVVVRIDDSKYLRRFVRIFSGPMLDYSTLNKLENSIQPKTWKKINKELGGSAVRGGQISGDALRLDTTAVETNIHYPTDSSLLWDVYRVLGRLIENAREIDAGAVGNKRLHKKRAKRLSVKISRKASKKKSNTDLKDLYMQLIGLVEGLCGWSGSVVEQLKDGVAKHRYGFIEQAVAEWIVGEMEHYLELAKQVIDQARRRIFEGEKVSNDEKLFSIFEPHTELLIRGKAGKQVEFGHMIQIQQVREKFITDYDVFEKKPVEHQLLESALNSHKDLFGSYPNSLAADKGYYKDMQAIKKLEAQIDTVSIAKKGRRTQEETEREQDPFFKHAQRFRAGVEGTISFLKRILRLFRCMRKGWEHFVAEVGATIFAHNLLILSRA